MPLIRATQVPPATPPRTHHRPGSQLEFLLGGAGQIYSLGQTTTGDCPHCRHGTPLVRRHRVHMFGTSSGIIDAIKLQTMLKKRPVRWRVAILLESKTHTH